jgi:hypothetical protein
MRRTAKKTGLLITSAAAGLATLSQCSAGLLSDFFDKHANKDREGIERRLPACDCSFGYFSTAWQPWGTCDQTSGVGCSSGNCSNSAPTILPGFQPGYSTGPSPNAMPSYGDSWNSHDNVLPPTTPHTFNGVPNSTDSSPAPILMTPLQPEPASEFPLSPSAASPPTTFQHPAGNPFPRAVRSNPELPNLNPNPYSKPTLMPAPGSPLPNAPQPGLSPGFSVPLDPQQTVTEPANSWNDYATASSSANTELRIIGNGHHAATSPSDQRYDRHSARIGRNDTDTSGSCTVGQQLWWSGRFSVARHSCRLGPNPTSTEQRPVSNAR